MEDKEIHAVGLVRRIRDDLYEETKGFSTEELIAFYHHRAAATRERLAKSRAGRSREASPSESQL